MPASPRCPRCRRDLERTPAGGAARWSCAPCGGCSVTVGALRQFAPADRVNALWQETWRGATASPLDCAACGGKMRRVTIPAGESALELDACKPCQSIWFDTGELAALSPDRQSAPTKTDALPPEAARALGEAMASEIARDARERRRAEALGRAFGGARSGRRAGHWLADALVDLWRA